MSKLLVSLLAAGGIAFAGSSFAATGTMSKDAYNAQKSEIKTQYDSDVAGCKSMSGNAKDVCVKEAKAGEVRGKADAKADKVAAVSSNDAAKKTMDARKDASEDKRDADYKVAAERCDSMAGDAKDQCVKAAKTHFGKS